ncbi:Pre-rRNA-processing protein ESF2 [Bienertia sinuspersici]
MGTDEKSADAKPIDPSSPYYLRSGDQPGNCITHVLLKNDNYVAWSRAITLSLKARRKFVFIDGSLPKPTDARTLLDWETVHSMLVSWILRSIDPKLAESIPFHDDVRLLWHYLERRFCVANGPRIQQLRAQISDCRQSKDMSIEVYYTKLLGLYDELNRIKPLHTCSCGKCTCDVVGKFAEDRREEIFHQFLIGVDDEYYAHVRSNLLSQSPPADLDRAYQALIQEERSRAIARRKLTLKHLTRSQFRPLGLDLLAPPLVSPIMPIKLALYVLTVANGAMIGTIALNFMVVRIGITSSSFVGLGARPILPLLPPAQIPLLPGPLLPFHGTRAKCRLVPMLYMMQPLFLLIPLFLLPRMMLVYLGLFLIHMPMLCQIPLWAHLVLLLLKG